MVAVRQLPYRVPIGVFHLFCSVLPAWAVREVWRRRIRLPAGLTLSLSVSTAHEGHNHANNEKSAAISSAFPRVTAHSDRYEVVGILKNGELSIFRYWRP